jgi:hypothetical protein
VRPPASAAPTITLESAVVHGTAVSLDTSLYANGSCGATPGNMAGCAANYHLSTSSA